MKFTLHEDINAIYITGSLSYNEDDFLGIEKAKLETTVSNGYIDKLLAEEWEDLKWFLDSDYKTFRNNLISTFSPSAVWDALLENSKKALIKNYVWKSTETIANLDLLYPQVERDNFQKECMEILNQSCSCVIRRSTDIGSRKYFDHQQADDGILIIKEVMTDEGLL